MKKLLLIGIICAGILPSVFAEIPSELTPTQRQLLNTLCSNIKTDPQYCETNWDRIKNDPSFPAICKKVTPSGLQSDCNNPTASLACDHISTSCKSTEEAIKSIEDR